MWSHRMDETDADEEWSDEDIAKATRNGETDKAISPHSYTNSLKRSTTLEPLSVNTDPISLVLCKIDAELEAIKRHDMKKTENTYGRLLDGTQRLPTVQQKVSMFENNYSVTGGSQETDLRSINTAITETLHGANLTGISTSEKGYKGATADGESRESKQHSDDPKDLDPFTAQEIDAKFKEILMKKKGRQGMSLTTRLSSLNANRPSASMLSTGYGTDNDSVKTEDFESKFLGMMVQPSENEAEFQETRNNKGDKFERLTPVAESTNSGINTTPKSIISRPRSLSPNRMRGDKKNVVIREVHEDHPGESHEREPIEVKIELQTERRARSVPPTPVSGSWGLSSLPEAKLSSSLSSRRGESYLKKKRDKKTDLGQSSTNLRTSVSETSDQTTADQEMNTYAQALHLTRKKLVEAHEEVRTARDMSERAKSELLALEFKRGNSSQELERLNNEIARKKTQLSTMEVDLQSKAEEAKNLRSLGLTREECLEVKAVKDENQSLRSTLRSVEGLQLERDELVRQLEATKEDLFREQKLARGRSEQLQEEIESLASKLEEAETNWKTAEALMMKMEASLKRVENEKNDLLQEKTRELEELKAAHKQQSVDSQNILKKEVSNLDLEVRELRSKVNDLQVEIAVKDAMADQLRSEINEIGAILDRERQDRHKTSVEQKNVLQHLRKETASAVHQLKESMFLEKQKALEDMKKELIEERREAASRSEERLAQVMEEHSYQIAEKNAEIARLEDALRELENYKLVEVEEQVRDAVARERERSEIQRDWQMRQEKEEEKRRCNELINNIEKEKQTNRELHTEMASLKKELEEQKRIQREASKDKLVAVARTKDQMKEQWIAEAERIKFNLKQEHEAEINRMKERCRDQEQELTRLRSEIDKLSEKEHLAVKALEHTERVLAAEIHSEIQRMLSFSGTSSRTLPPSSLHFEASDGRVSLSFKHRPPVHSALVNLHACIDELQRQMAQMQQEQESLTVMLKAVTKEKEEAINNCKLEMDRQRIQDLEKLKEKLLKEHVAEMSNVIQECAEANSQMKTNSEILKRYGDAALLEALQAKDDELHTMEVTLAKWQRETEEKFNTQLQLQVAKEREKYQALQHHSTREQKRIHDLQKREIDRLEKEVQKFAVVEPLPVASASKSPHLPPSASNLKTSQQQLQGRIEQLQAENAALRKQRMLNSNHLSWSTSNLHKLTRPPSPFTRSGSPSHDIDRIHRLEGRIRQEEQETQKVQERVKVNQKMMNNKMEEMMKLQNTLFVQNQELQELERSYNDLQKHYHSRPCSPTRNLNTTM